MAAVTDIDRRVPSPPSSLDVHPLVDWLLTEGWNITDPKDLIREFGRQMVTIGIPLYRLRVNIRILHPQFLGTTYTWVRGRENVEEFMPPYEILTQDSYLTSPFAAIFEGAGGIRRRLDVPGEPLDYPILADLRAEGATDYVAMPLVFSDGRINAVTIAADRPGGFSSAELGMINDMLPVFSRLLEVHALRRTTLTILETYLGRLAGARVLQGSIKRGDGEVIHAVIWFSDLRGSTRLADRLPRGDFLGLLNDYFEGMAGAVLDHEGEVLRFIGDAALAIFPIGTITDCPERCPHHIRACKQAISAARDAALRIATVNRRREEAGSPLIRFGIGLHLGDVLYGNIGTLQRLEFSVIGAAANEAARIEALCKQLHRPVLISETVARVAPDGLTSCGVHALRGVGAPMEIFTLPQTATGDTPNSH
ncbi:MAG: adenylate/guanylate cyclase domain-containing protein [Rhodospirillales bacterium]|nr:adenylate/guanylate cyclase domain-containing protein [Rhodospirillales bacterium]